MSLLKAIFGAKPAYDVPPFAGPHPNTGGANVPTVGGAMPSHGLAGFLDRALMPTNALGMFGQALVAAGGGPLGTAEAYLMQSRPRAKGPHFEHIGDSFGVVDDATGQFTPTYTAPKAPEHHYWESNDGSLMDLTADGPTKVYEDPTPKMNFIPDGMGGGQWVAVPTAAPTMPSLPSGGPVGKITPIDDPAPASAPPAGGTVDKFKGAVIGQESGGRYGVANTEGSGAMGVGQVMPGTARVLAGRLGLPFRPDLLAGTDPTAQAYQNRITDAAVQEAWNAGNGDPAIAAKYYFGGSNRSKWGPKTRRYASDILSRMGS
jgi:hypothetical protein